MFVMKLRLFKRSIFTTSLVSALTAVIFFALLMSKSAEANEEDDELFEQDLLQEDTQTDYGSNFNDSMQQEQLHEDSLQDYIFLVEEQDQDQLQEESHTDYGANLNEAQQQGVPQDESQTEYTWNFNELQQDRQQDEGQTEYRSEFNEAPQQDLSQDDSEADQVSNFNEAQQQQDLAVEESQAAYSTEANEAQQPYLSQEETMDYRSNVNDAVDETQNQPQDDSSTDSATNFVRIINAPETLTQSSKIIVEYHCEDNSVVSVDLIVMIVDYDTYYTVYSRAWTCFGQGLEGKPKVKTIRLRLPDNLVYRPDYFLKADTMWQVSWCKLRAWLVEEDVWSREEGVDIQARKETDISIAVGFPYSMKRQNLHISGTRRSEVKCPALFLKQQNIRASRSRDIHSVTVLPPYSRPYKRVPCPIGIWPYLQKLHTFSDFQNCPVEQEYVTLLDYPAVFNGYNYGFIRELSPFKDWRLEKDRLQRRHFPQFSVELWVYILDYCPLHHLSPADACGLFVHMNSQGWFLSPALLINKDGNIQVDMKGSNGFIALKTMDIVPKNKWARILFTFNERKWILHVNYGPDMKDGFWTSHTYDANMYVDDTEGLLSIGGIDWTMGSIVGYMGRVVYHRRKALVPEQLSVPASSHPMFELHLTRRQKKCDHFLSWMDSAVDVFQKYRRYVMQQREDICHNEPLIFFKQYLNGSDEVTTCPLMNPYNRHHHRHVSRLLRRAVLAYSLSTNFLEGSLEAYARNYRNVSQANVHEISVELLETAKSIVSEKGLKDSGRVVHILKQAACLGNDDAMYSLAVMLNNGVGCQSDDIQSLAFFMLGVLNRHLLSVMALGHRHVMGIDGAPVDNEVAFLYYKQVADMTRTHKEHHTESGIATETIRLIDEAAIEAQTSEVGDLFLWLKNQAEKGVASAQSQLGAMLYHGAKGLKRNLQTAINVFKDGAETGNVDAMFNYGLMQYRGMGAEANKTEGKRLLQKAAELNNPNAVSALGWVALQVDHNYTEAYEMFTLAKKLGHMDSGYYLGFMHHFGKVPNQTYDLDRALEEYFWSAKKEHIDAGSVYAFLLSRGTPRTKRNIHHALQWARYIAEKNAHLALPLREALNAFRDGNYDLALYLYLMLADTGLEVASFNLAYLCEQNKDGLRSYISKECEWRHYNMSVQREPHFVDAYSYIKMGDYHWYGCKGQRNLNEAAKLYSQAALKGNPQALFNLAYMVEEGAQISPVIWWMLHLTPDIYTNKVTLLLELYGRCRESRQSEAFIPCCLAWFRVWCLDVWKQYHIYMKITSFLGVFVAAATTSYLLYNYFLQRRLDKDKEEERKAEEEERTAADGERKAEEEKRTAEEDEIKTEGEEEEIVRIEEEVQDI